jgi:hypothetical protein
MNNTAVPLSPRLLMNVDKIEQDIDCEILSLYPPCNDCPVFLSYVICTENALDVKSVAQELRRRYEMGGFPISMAVGVNENGRWTDVMLHFLGGA